MDGSWKDFNINAAYLPAFIKTNNLISNLKFALVL
jgi:hypothetical protein